jgi:hypothetical protein
MMVSRTHFVFFLKIMINKILPIILVVVLSGFSEFSKCNTSLPSNEWHMCSMTEYFIEDYVKDIGATYTGDYKFGEMNGEGTLAFTDGTKYVGQFKDNWPHGHGTLTFSNGKKYVGQFKDGQRHGQGTFIFANGAKYTGAFKDGQRHGQGTLTYVYGTEVVVEYKNGELQ